MGFEWYSGPESWGRSIGTDSKTGESLLAWRGGSREKIALVDDLERWGRVRAHFEQACRMACERFDKD